MSGAEQPNVAGRGVVMVMSECGWHIIRMVEPGTGGHGVRTSRVADPTRMYMPQRVRQVSQRLCVARMARRINVTWAQAKRRVYGHRYVEPP